MSKKQKRILLPVFLVTMSVCAALALVSARTAGLVRSPNGRTSTDTKRIGPSSPFASFQGQGKGQRVQVQVEQLTLWPTGFRPAEITRPSGPVALVIANNSGVRELSLRLDEESGNKLREVRLTEGKREWREYIELHPGNYVITEARHPAWLCRLHINAH
jgi:hypothetical protein